MKQKGMIKNIGIIFILMLMVVIIGPSLFQNLKFGLDLQGGFEVLYQVKSIDGSKVTSDMVNNTYKTIQKRIDVLGVSEPIITVEGNDKIRVQLAGITDPEEARMMLSTAANLTFRDTSDQLLMNSDVLKSGGAKVGEDSSGKPAVALSIKNKDKFYKVTKKVSTMQDNRIVIWLDYDEEENSFQTEQNSCGSLNNSKCLSVATVSQGFASDVIIQGNFTQDEVKNLVELINSGSLPTKLEEVSSKTVAASFGSHSLEKTFTAGIVGIVFIMLFMIIIYRFSGFIASIGMILYTFITFAIFWLIGGVLTLPGIAAILLGIGMAIDANVINFARIKDELSKGKSLKSAYIHGNKNSLVTIIDSNVTTLLVAIILFIFGESSIKGFATMLIISILTTMFVMVILTRWLLKLFVYTGYFDQKTAFFIGYKKQNKKKQLDFIKYSRVFFGISIVCIILGIVSLGFNGLHLGIDFKGGSSITIKTKQSVTEKQLKQDFKELKYDLQEVDVVDDQTVYAKVGDKLSKKQVIQTEKYFEDKYQASTDIGVVSNMVKKELVKNAFVSLALASLGMIIYISLRFKFSYAISAIVALLHDVFLMVAVFSIFQLEVSSIFIAAILSIIGYSVNDTIVAFDRIRETLSKKEQKKLTSEDLKEVINTSLQSTLSRSLITSITTIIPVIALIILGSYEIINFNIALLIGLVVGSYSSICIASQLWYILEKKQIGKPPKKKWYEDEIEERKIKGINS